MSLQPIKKILCPVDFSEFSHQVALEAFGLARSRGAKLLLLNVVNERLFSELERLGGRIGGLGEVAQEAIGTAEEDRAHQMRRFLAEVEEQGPPLDDVDHSSRIAVGVPWERILEVAQEEAVDLIVMGAKGHSALTRALRFGNSAEKVFRRAECRVLFVR